jgi:hypothetical protein
LTIFFILCALAQISAVSRKRAGEAGRSGKAHQNKDFEGHRAAVTENWQC